MPVVTDVASKDYKSEQNTQQKNIAKLAVDWVENITKKELYIKVFTEEFIRELVYYNDVAQKRAQPRDTFTTQITKSLKQVISLVPKAGDAFEKLSSVAEFAANAVRDEETRCMANLQAQLDLSRIQILVDIVAREAYRRYEYFIQSRMCDQHEYGVIPFARVGVTRVLEYIMRQRASMSMKKLLQQNLAKVAGEAKLDAKQDTSWSVEISESFLLVGLMEGRSGFGVSGFSNTPIRLKETKSKLGRDVFREVDAEDVYARSGMMNFEYKDGHLEQKLYVRKTAKHHEGDIGQRLKALFQGETEKLYNYGLVKFRNSERHDPKCGYVVMPLSVITGRYDFTLQDKKEISGTLRGELFENPTLSVVAIDKATLREYVNWYRKQPAPMQAVNTVARFLQVVKGWRGARWVICHDDLRDVDLQNVNLSQMDLSGSTLPLKLDGTQFNQSYLIATRVLPETSAKGCNFVQACCQFIVAEKVNFDGSDFTQANCSFGKMAHSQFKNTKTQGTVWHKTDLQKTVSDVDLVKAQEQQLVTLQDSVRQQQQDLRSITEALALQQKQINALPEKIEALLEKQTKEIESKLQEQLTAQSKALEQQQRADLKDALKPISEQLKKLSDDTKDTEEKGHKRFEKLEAQLKKSFKQVDKKLQAELAPVSKKLDEVMDQGRQQQLKSQELMLQLQQILKQQEAHILFETYCRSEFQQLQQKVANVASQQSVTELQQQIRDLSQQFEQAKNEWEQLQKQMWVSLDQQLRDLGLQANDLKKAVNGIKEELQQHSQVSAVRHNQVMAEIRNTEKILQQMAADFKQHFSKLELVLEQQETRLMQLIDRKVEYLRQPLPPESKKPKTLARQVIDIKKAILEDRLDFAKQSLRQLLISAKKQHWQIIQGSEEGLASPRLIVNHLMEIIKERHLESIADIHQIKFLVLTALQNYLELMIITEWIKDKRDPQDKKIQIMADKKEEHHKALETFRAWVENNHKDEIELHYALDCCVGALETLWDGRSGITQLIDALKATKGTIGDGISTLITQIVISKRNKRWYADVLGIRCLLLLAQHSETVMQSLQVFVVNNKMLGSKDWQISYTLQEVFYEIAAATNLYAVRERAISGESPGQEQKQQSINLNYLVECFLMNPNDNHKDIKFRYRLIQALVQLKQHPIAWLKIVAERHYNSYHKKQRPLPEKLFQQFKQLETSTQNVLIPKQPILLTMAAHLPIDEKQKVQLLEYKSNKVSNQSNQLFQRLFKDENLEQKEVELLQRDYLSHALLEPLLLNELIVRSHLLHRLVHCYLKWSNLAAAEQLYKTFLPFLRKMPLDEQLIFYIRAGDSYISGAQQLEQYQQAANYYRLGLALAQQNRRIALCETFELRLEQVFINLVCQIGYFIVAHQFEVDQSTYSQPKNLKEFAHFFKQLKPLLETFYQGGYKQALAFFKDLLTSHVKGYLKCWAEIIAQMGNEQGKAALEKLRQFYHELVMPLLCYGFQDNIIDMYTEILSKFIVNADKYVVDEIQKQHNEVASWKPSIIVPKPIHFDWIKSFADQFTHNLKQKAADPSSQFLQFIGQSTQQAYNWIGAQFVYIQNLLGSPPCGFAIMALQYTDLPGLYNQQTIRYLLLLEKDSERNHPYFEGLIQLTTFMVNEFIHTHGIQLHAASQEQMLCGTPAFIINKLLHDKTLLPNKPYFPVLLCSIFKDGQLWLLNEIQVEVANALHQRFVDKEQPRKTMASAGRLNSKSLAVETLGLHCKKYMQQTKPKHSFNSKDTLQALAEWCTSLALYYDIPSDSNSSMNLFALVTYLRDHEKALSPHFAERLLKALDYLARQPILANHKAKILAEIQRLVLRPAYLVASVWRDAQNDQLQLIEPILFYVTQLFRSKTLGLSADQAKTSGLSPRDVNEDDISILVETLCLNQASEKQHVACYQLLRHDLQKVYYEQLTQWVQEISTKHSAQYALTALNEFSDKKGNRRVINAARKRWQKVLSQLTEPCEVAEDESVSKPRLRLKWHDGKQLQTCVLHSKIQAHWQSQNFIDAANQIQESVRQLTDGRRMVIPLYKPGVALPVKLSADEKSVVEHEEQPLAFAKVYPEMPGGQSLAQNLAWHLSGYSLMGGLVRLMTGNSQVSYPIYLSLNVGETLQQVLCREGHLNRIEARLHAKSFTLKVIETLLLGYEDDKLDNIAVVEISTPSGVYYRLVSVDSDRAFAELVVGRTIETDVIHKEVKVNCKTVVFCMQAMQDILDPDAVAEFLRLNRNEVLANWLQQQEKDDKANVARNPKDTKSLFTLEEMQRFADHKPDDSYLNAAFQPGVIKQLYQRWLRIRAILSDKNNRSYTHFDLVRNVEPHLASFYEDVWEKGSPQQRFWSLPTGYQTVEEKPSEGRERFFSNVMALIAQTTPPLNMEMKQLILLYLGAFSGANQPAKSVSPKAHQIVIQHSINNVQQRVMKSLTLAKPGLTMQEAIRQGQFYSPHRAHNELLEVHHRYEQIGQVITDLKSGKTKSFIELGNDHYIKEQVIKGVNFAELKPVERKGTFGIRSTESRQIPILNAMIGTQFYHLNLKGCTELTDDRLLKILRTCPDLLSLDVRGCIQLTDGFIRHMVTYQYCPRLEKLYLDDLPRLKFLVQMDWLRKPIGAIDFPKLRRLSINGCHNLVQLNLKAPRLEDIDAKSCTQLSPNSVQIPSSPLLVVIKNLWIDIRKNYQALPIPAKGMIDFWQASQQKVVDNFSNFDPQRILMIAEAGYGKSVWCRSLAMQWATGKLWQGYFDGLLFLQLGHLNEHRYPPLPKGQSYSVADIVVQECYQQPLCSLGKMFLAQQFFNRRVLWVLDGFDEIVANIPDHLKEVLQQLLRMPYQLLTSRPGFTGELHFDETHQLDFATNPLKKLSMTQFYQTTLPKLEDDFLQHLAFLTMQSPKLWWNLNVLPKGLSNKLCKQYHDSLKRALANGTIQQVVTAAAEPYYRFTHRVTQASLAARYLVYSLQDSPTDESRLQEITTYLSSYKYDRLQKPVLVFAAGLLGVDQSSEGQDRFQYYLQLLNAQPRDLVGVYHRELINACMAAVHDQKRALDDKEEKSFSMRRAEIKAIGRGTGAPISNQDLVALFDRMHRNQDARARQNTILALGHMGAGSTTETANTIIAEVLKLSDDKDIGIRKAVIATLGQLGGKVPTTETVRLMVVLMGALKDQNPIIKVSGIEAVGEIGPAVATLVVYEALKKLTDENVAEAKQAFNKIFHPEPTLEILPHLLRALKAGHHVWIQTNALELIGKIGPIAATPQTLNTLIDLLKPPFIDSEVIISAIETLKQLGPRAAAPGVFDVLIQFLNPDIIVIELWYAAVSAFALLEEWKFIPTLSLLPRVIEALQREDNDISICAAHMLIRTSFTPIAPDVVKALFVLLKSLIKKEEDNDRSLLLSVGKVLAQMGGVAATPEVLQTLIAMLKSKVRLLKYHAAEILGCFGPVAATPEVLEALVAALSDKDTGVISRAIIALGRMGRAAAIPDVVQALLKLKLKLNYTTKSAILIFRIVKALMQMGIVRLELISLANSICSIANSNLADDNDANEELQTEEYNDSDTLESIVEALKQLIITAIPEITQQLPSSPIDEEDKSYLSERMMQFTPLRLLLTERRLQTCSELEQLPEIARQQEVSIIIQQQQLIVIDAQGQHVILINELIRESVQLFLQALAERAYGLDGYVHKIIGSLLSVQQLQAFTQMTAGPEVFRLIHYLANDPNAFFSVNRSLLPSPKVVVSKAKVSATLAGMDEDKQQSRFARADAKPAVATAALIVAARSPIFAAAPSTKDEATVGGLDLSVEQTIMNFSDLL